MIMMIICEVSLRTIICNVKFDFKKIVA